MTVYTLAERGLRAAVVKAVRPPLPVGGVEQTFTGDANNGPLNQADFDALKNGKRLYFFRGTDKPYNTWINPQINAGRNRIIPPVPNIGVWYLSPLGQAFGMFPQSSVSAWNSAFLKYWYAHNDTGSGVGSFLSGMPLAAKVIFGGIAIMATGGALGLIDGVGGIGSGAGLGSSAAGSIGSVGSAASVTESVIPQAAGEVSQAGLVTESVIPQAAGEVSQEGMLDWLPSMPSIPSLPPGLQEQIVGGALKLGGSLATSAVVKSMAPKPVPIVPRYAPAASGQSSILPLILAALGALLIL